MITDFKQLWPMLSERYACSEAGGFVDEGLIRKTVFGSQGNGQNGTRE